MSDPAQTLGILLDYFNKLYPDDPKLASDAAAANAILGWLPPEHRTEEYYRRLEEPEPDDPEADEAAVFDSWAARIEQSRMEQSRIAHSRIAHSPAGQPRSDRAPASGSATPVHAAPVHAAPGPAAPAASAAAPAAAKRRVDWGEAARLLAAGTSIQDAACRLRCDPQVIRRNLRRSRKFRLRIQSEHEYCRLTAQLRFGALGDFAVSRLKLQPDNPRLLQWLGDRIGLGELADRQGGALATRFQAVLRPGKRVPTPEEEEQQKLGRKEIEMMIREADEWHAAKEAHDRMKFEKREFEERQRREAKARETAESAAERA